MEESRKTNYLSAKFLLDNAKKDKDNLIKQGFGLRGSTVQDRSIEIVRKEYYDTPDFFMHDHGITINKNIFKKKPNAELVVRYESEKERIRFLSDIPDTFAIEIPAKMEVSKFGKFIADCISQLIPNGLSVDVQKVTAELKLTVAVEKKREQYRILNINGFKATYNFTQAIYSSPNTSSKNYKQKLDILEIESEITDKQKEFNEVVRKIAFDNPNYIQLKNSDIQIAREYLFNEK